MRVLLLALLPLALVASAPLASASADAEAGPCTGDPDAVAACGCPDGFWGVTLYVQGEPSSFVCFF